MGDAREGKSRSGCLSVADPKIHHPQAEFLFVPADQVMDVAKREGATPYDVKGVEFGHRAKFGAIPSSIARSI